MSPIMAILATTITNPRPITALLKVLQLIFYIGSLYIYSTRFRMMYKLRWFENADHGIFFLLIFFYIKIIIKNSRAHYSGSKETQLVQN